MKLKPNTFTQPPVSGLADPAPSRDACGIGFVATLNRAPSREVVDLGLSALGRLLHRGAVGADADSGDGAGMLLDLPQDFMRRMAAAAGMALPEQADFAVGVVFLPQAPEDRRAIEVTIEGTVRAGGLDFLGWRAVPCQPETIGAIARSRQPVIRQCFVGAGAAAADTFESSLFPLRKRIEAAVAALKAGLNPASHDLFSVVSLSSRTIIYKGQLTATQLGQFYPDLLAPDFTSRLAMFHQRFSTNTQPSWRLAQPFRFTAHNGEINTVRGNRNWMRARAGSWKHPICGLDPAAVLPVLEPGGSDSAAFDNTAELLLRSGRPLPQAMMMMMPEAWEGIADLPERRRGFYAYHANLLEPWDGPAAITFCDGTIVGAALDRNGLRPARYQVSKAGLVVLASEAGVVDIDPQDVLTLGRLEPGEILAVDLGQGLVLHNLEVKDQVSNLGDFGLWEAERVSRLDTDRVESDAPELPTPSMSELLPRLSCYGYTAEELTTVLAPAALSGHEAVASMGNDAALAGLSRRPRLLFDYFAQGFAQVTNPPIDHIRERRVMSLRTTLGPGGDLLAPSPAIHHRLELEGPILSDGAMTGLRSGTLRGISVRTLAALFSPHQGPSELARALEQLCQQAERAVEDGIAVLILSDRESGPDLAPIPSLLAAGAVHHHLVRAGLRTKLSLVVESAEPRSVHHIACLVGHGAEAVNPYLALEVVSAMASEGQLPVACSRVQARLTYSSMLAEGLLKVLSKLGISTLASYCGSQVFEAVGIASEVMDRCFAGTPSRLEGAGFSELAEDVLARHRAAYYPAGSGRLELELGGEHRWRSDGEAHAWNPDSVAALQHAVRQDSPQRYEDYRRLADADDGPAVALRHLLEPRAGLGVAIEEVEPASAIVRRFVTGAMSLGALGKEAHENLALAMNQLGGKSNTGEGGEDPSRYGPSPKRSAIKQVASARFGVTIDYLVSADDIQIKMAQGAKPGEGGQLPGHKVDGTIARLRHSTPGVELISPPPHHDIYSIEDLAQLIWDLKQTNPKARISVKLVSSSGVGTVAAGVAKAKGDHITISGHDGGTGAAVLSSIKHAGLPWELGLAETQQTLVQQGLRSRVVVQVDGGLRTGRDVVIAAMLGAEEFGFATAALIASGCVLMRVCHLNTCPVGIATQDPVLRERFSGTPEDVIRFFMMVAEDTRGWMARCGFRTVDEMVGRADRLGPRARLTTAKEGKFDLSPLLAPPRSDVAPLLPEAARADASALRNLRSQDHQLDRALDLRIIAQLGSALERGRPARLRFAITNRDRAVGSRLSGEIARLHGGNRLADGTYQIDLAGVAGQSLGAWLCKGVTLTVNGSANDYPGKGLSGGVLAVRPPEGLDHAEQQVIAGNVALYGATSGEAYFAGRAGERFAVRNSGALAVVQGVGDHGCEYMTGGTVLVLGPTGQNFGAGMTGGLAYLLGPVGAERVNQSSVKVEAASAEDLEAVRDLLQRHQSHTGSALAGELLADWAQAAEKVLVVRPRPAPALPAPVTMTRSDQLQSAAAGA